MGWGSDPDVPNQLAKTAEQQAELLDESLAALLEEREPLDLRGVIWFTWRDFDAPIGECGWCPVRRPARRRPRHQARLAGVHRAERGEP